MGSRLLLGLFVVAALGAILWVAISGGDSADVDPERAGPAARPDDDVVPPPVAPDESVATAEGEDAEEAAENVDGTGTLLVTVTDPEKRALAGCVVTADGRTATTGADGVARFADLPAGKRISVVATGPNPQDVRRSTRVVLKKDEEKRATLVVYPGGGIRGVVRGPGGAVLTVPFKVTVEPTAVVGHLEGRLNEVRVSRNFPAGDGSFTFPRIRPGGYVVRATAKGFVEAEARPFHIKAGEFTEGIEITLRAGGSVAGVVVDRGTGEPVAGARVGLGGAEHMIYLSTGGGLQVGGRHTATTDERGAFRIEDVEPGKFRVSAAAKGWTSASLDDVEVAAGVETGGLRLELGRGATITGTVYGPDGKPEAGKTVLVQQVVAQIDFQGDYGRREKTDANGVYRAEGLQPGRYRVKLPASERHTGFAIAFSGGSMDGDEDPPAKGPLGPDMVEVAEGQTVTKDLRAAPRARVHGTVKTREGKPMRQTVRLKKIEENKSDPARPRLEIPRMEHPDAEGVYVFEGLEPGTWRLSCGDRSETVEVGPGDVVEVPFVLNPARVEGIVVDAVGRGIEGVTVQASALQRLEDGPFARGHISPVRTGKDGRFTFPVVFSGTWTFRGAKDDTKGQSEEIVVAEGAHVREVRIELITLTELTVKIVDAGGQPKAEIFVVVNSGKTGESTHGRTNAAGVAVLRIRGGAEYTIHAWEGGGTQASGKVKVTRGVPAEIEITLK